MKEDIKKNNKEDVKNELLQFQDEDYKKFNQKLCPDTKYKMIGIRIPKLREIAKELAKKNYNPDDIDNEYFEEVVVQGFTIGYSKMELKEKLKYIKKFVPKIDSWAICDTFCPTLKIKEKDKNEVWNFILPYLNSKKEFEVRFAIIMMLDYYIVDEYIDLVLENLDNVKNEGYYAKMAVAWVLAETGIKYYSKLMSFLKGKNNLDDFTYNKAIQKMRESSRISMEQKEILKKMKK